MPQPTRHASGVLSREECLDLLRTQPVGRVVFTLDALPVVVPVGYRVEDGGVVVRARRDSRLAKATVHTIVAFEADHFDPGYLTGWTVSVIGTAVPLPTTTERLDATMGIAAPEAGLEPYFVLIAPSVVSGKRLVSRA